MSKKPFFTECPRCGSNSFEHMSDYCHCPHCLYVEDYYEDAETCYAAVRSLDEKLLSLNPQQEEKQPDETESLAS